MDPNSPNFLEKLSDLLGVEPEDMENFLDEHSVASDEPLENSEEESLEDQEEDDEDNDSEDEE